MRAFYDAAARDTCGRLLPRKRHTQTDAGSLSWIMAAYRMRGTPTLLLIDREGRLRHYHLGQVDNIALGAQIAMLAAESMRALRFGGEAAAPAGSTATAARRSPRIAGSHSVSGGETDRPYSCMRNILLTTRNPCHAQLLREQTSPSQWRP